jgi:hypothetical protein
MSATQPIGTYRDSVHEVVLGRAGPYGFVVSLVVVTLGLYGLRGTPHSVDVVALLLGGAAGVAVAGTLGIRRRGRVSREEALPERWLDFHPLAVAVSAAAGIAVGSASIRDTAAWVVGAAVAGMVYVLVAAAELAFRRRQAHRAARRAREAVAAPMQLGTGVPVSEWRHARRRSIEALVQLDGPARAAAEAHMAVAVAVPEAAEPEPVEPQRAPEPHPGLTPAPEAAAVAVAGGDAALVEPPPAEPPPAEPAVAEPAAPPAAKPASAPATPASPRASARPTRPPAPAQASSARMLLIVAGVAVIGLVLVVRLLRR